MGVSAVQVQDTVMSRRNAGLLELPYIPPALRPAVRAYALGYASAVGPRLLTLVLQHLSKRRRRRLHDPEVDNNGSSFLDSATHIIKTGFDVERFPTFCAVLAGGSTFIRVCELQVFMMTLEYNHPR